MTPTPRQHPLLCQCGTCRTPFAVIQNGCLVIIAKHGSDRHVNILKLEDLAAMLKAAADGDRMQG